MEIELSSRCNAECPGCLRTILKERNIPFKKEDLDIDLFFNRFETYSFAGVTLKLCGVLGDPMMHPRLVEFVERAIAKKAFVEVSTNGGLRSKETWKQLGKISEETKQLLINFSVDGLEGINEIYRVNTKFSKIKENMESYKEAGGQAQWIFIEFPHNTHQASQVKDEAQKLGFHFMTRRAIRNSINILKDGSTVPIKKAVESKVNHPHTESAVKVIAAQKSGGEEREIRCKFKHQNELFLSADSSVWPCCFLWDEYNSDRSHFNADLLKTMNDEGWNNLESKGIDEILGGSFYIGLENYWKQSSQMYIQRCGRSCGEKGQLQNHLESQGC